MRGGQPAPQRQPEAVPEDLHLEPGQRVQQQRRPAHVQPARLGDGLGGGLRLRGLLRRVGRADGQGHELGHLQSARRDWCGAGRGYSQPMRVYSPNGQHVYTVR